MKLVCSVFALFILVVTVNGDCGVVTKKEWNSMASMHVEYLARPVDLVIIQHTETPTCNTDSECEEVVRNIQTNHTDNLGYWDIGYSFLIGGNGKVYEGAGWLHVGAHTYGYNSKSIGITFFGNYDFWSSELGAIIRKKADFVRLKLRDTQNCLLTLFSDRPDCPIRNPWTILDDSEFRASLEVLKALLRCGVENGHLTSNYHIVGHHQILGTPNPGSKLYNEIRTWPQFLSDVSSIRN